MEPNLPTQVNSGSASGASTTPDFNDPNALLRWIVAGGLRHIASTLAGIIVAHGFAEKSDTETLIGVLVALGMFAWSALEKTVKNAAHQGALRDVFEMVTTGADNPKPETRNQEPSSSSTAGFIQPRTLAALALASLFALGAALFLTSCSTLAKWQADPRVQFAEQEALKIGLAALDRYSNGGNVDSMWGISEGVFALTDTVNAISARSQSQADANNALALQLAQTIQSYASTKDTRALAGKVAAIINKANPQTDAQRAAIVNAIGNSLQDAAEIATPSTGKAIVPPQARLSPSALRPSPSRGHPSPYVWPQPSLQLSIEFPNQKGAGSNGIRNGQVAHDDEGVLLVWRRSETAATDDARERLTRETGLVVSSNHAGVMLPSAGPADFQPRFPEEPWNPPLLIEPVWIEIDLEAVNATLLV